MERRIGQFIIPGEEIIFRSDSAEQPDDYLQEILEHAGVLRKSGTVCDIGDGELIIRTPKAAANADLDHDLLRLCKLMHTKPETLVGKEITITFGDREPVEGTINLRELSDPGQIWLRSGTKVTYLDTCQLLSEELTSLKFDFGDEPAGTSFEPPKA